MDTRQKSGPWILRGKTRPPLRHVSLVKRKKLVASLDSLLGYRASVVVAPAGYGKTTLLSQWRERLITAGSAVGWLNLDADDDDPHRFFCYTILSLADAGVELGELERLVNRGLTDLPLESVLASLLAAIEQSKGHVILILDDYHRLEAPLIDDLLDKVIENSPNNFHLIVSSRQRPTFSVAHLCATGLGIEIDSKALRFSNSEIELALSDINNEDMIAHLTNTTEGWPVAVQLARLAYSKETGLTSVMGVTGREEHIAEFFSEQVVYGLPGDMQSFLTRTALLGQFNHELANAAYDGEESWRLLGELSDLKPMIVSLDGEGDWYRYHHLFAEYLVRLLKEREPKIVPVVYSRASVWYEQDGDLYQAVRYAVLADDLSRAASLIEAAGGWAIILYCGVGYLRNLLNLIPADRISDYPRLGIANACLSLRAGKVAAARAQFDRACAQHQMQFETAGAANKWFLRDRQNIGVLLSIHEDSPASDEQVLGDGVQTLPNGEPDCMANAVLAYQLAVQGIYAGRFDSSSAAIRDAMQYMRQAECTLGLNYCYAYAAINDFHQCNVNQALANALESGVMAAENVGIDTSVKSMSDVVTVSLRFWRDEIATNDWVQFETSLNHLMYNDGWFELFALGLETQIDRHLLHGETAAARHCVEQAKKLAQSRAMDRLEWHAETMELRVAVESNDNRAQQTLGRRIAKRFPVGEWQKNRYFWRTHVHSALALANCYRKQHPKKAESFVKDAIECSRELGARFLLLRSLTSYAVLLYRCNRREHALEVLCEAAQIAESHGVSLAPAAVMGSSLKLLQYAQSHWRKRFIDTATTRSVGKAINTMHRLSAVHVTASKDIRLSPREQAVLLELSRGHSNKEIARELDTTEHTVKFHLKNLFRKLSVGRRTEALKVAYEHGLI